MSAATPIPGVSLDLTGPALAPGLTPGQLAERLLAMPDQAAGLERRDVTTAADSATAVYVADEEQSRPRYGMAVVLIVAPEADAAAKIAAIQRSRWGDPAEHHVTASDPGGGERPAYVAFWRVFPPGLFAIPNQPVYFAIWYPAGEGYACMAIGGEPAIREALTQALAATLSAEPGE